MNIPPEEKYSKDEFIRYLITHSSEVFDDDRRRKWLKIYSILVSDDGWRNELFKEGEAQAQGDVYKICPRTETTPWEEDYFLVEYCPGLVLLFTTAADFQYRKDLEKRIKKTVGASRMWLRPDLFRTYWKGFLREEEGYVYRFTSMKHAQDDINCQIRPFYKRRLNYTGNDATQTLEEMRELYGVIPKSLYLQVTHDLKIHITNDGLFSAQEPSETALNLFFQQLDRVKDEVIDMVSTSKAMKFEIIGDSLTKNASIVAGIITLKRELDAGIADGFRKDMQDFSFIDVHLETGSLSMTATVVDDLKGSIFNISATESQILLVPKFRPTFESFLNFYRSVVETFDENARLSLVS